MGSRSYCWGVNNAVQNYHAILGCSMKILRVGWENTYVGLVKSWMSWNKPASARRDRSIATSPIAEQQRGLEEPKEGKEHIPKGCTKVTGMSGQQKKCHEKQKSSFVSCCYPVIGFFGNEIFFSSQTYFPLRLFRGSGMVQETRNWQKSIFR